MTFLVEKTARERRQNSTPPDLADASYSIKISLILNGEFERNHMQFNLLFG